MRYPLRLLLARGSPCFLLSCARARLSQLWLTSAARLPLCVAATATGVAAGRAGALSSGADNPTIFTLTGAAASAPASAAGLAAAAGSGTAAGPALVANSGPAASSAAAAAAHVAVAAADASTATAPAGKHQHGAPP